MWRWPRGDEHKGKTPSVYRDVADRMMGFYGVGCDPVSIKRRWCINWNNSKVISKKKTQWTIKWR